MNAAGSGLVDIVRDFLAAYQLTLKVSRSYRRDELDFDQVQALVGDDERSVLYRLKERCHALFRSAGPSADAAMRREALFDLAIGALFHETMKLRETFYQLVVYGPKLRELRGDADEGADSLLREFERILEGARVRIDEALLETDTLLAQTRDQFRSLLMAHPEDGLVTRYLIEHREAVEKVFDEGLDGLLAQIHGNGAEAYARAGSSYLRSGYFTEAGRELNEAIGRGADRPELRREVDYAAGMEAYTVGRYAGMLSHLESWLDSGPGAGPAEAEQARMALDAVVLLAPVVGGEPGPSKRRADEVAERLRQLAAASEATTSDPD